MDAIPIYPFLDAKNDCFIAIIPSHVVSKLYDLSRSKRDESMKKIESLGFDVNKTDNPIVSIYHLKKVFKHEIF